MFGVSKKQILTMMLVTVGAMFAMNYLAGVNPTARKLIRGASVSGGDIEPGSGYVSDVA